MADVAELKSVASPEPGPDQRAETAELVRMFRELVVRLPDRQAEVFKTARGSVDQAQVGVIGLDAVDVPFANEVAQVVEHVVDRA